jgi:hypothetical protein
MATISRLSYEAGLMSHGTRGKAKSHVVPAERIFRLLGIAASELENETVTVDAKGLRRLMQEFARHQPFDPEYYGESNPDIEAARLAGHISDLHEHFIRSGFFEGRLPAEPPFDPVWYAAHYTDLAATIPAHDVKALRNHFLSAGLAEGRAGTEASLMASQTALSDPS